MLVIAEPMLISVPRRSIRWGRASRASIRGATKFTSICRRRAAGSASVKSVGRPKPALLIRTSSPPKAARASRMSLSGVAGSRQVCRYDQDRGSRGPQLVREPFQTVGAAGGQDQVTSPHGKLPRDRRARFLPKPP